MLDERGGGVHQRSSGAKARHEQRETVVQLSCASPSGRWSACVDGGKEKAGMSGGERGGSYSRKLTAAG